MSAPDPVGDALAAALEVPFVTHFVAVAAAVTEDGESVTYRVATPGLPLWMQHGLLSFEASATVAQPTWSADDEEDDDE